MSSSTTDPALAGAALVDVTMPAMGTSIVEATVVEWKLAVGDAIAADAPICDISSDKVDSEVPSPCAGTVAELLVEVGETVEVGTVLARIATADAPAPAAPAEPAGPPEDRTSTTAIQQEPSAPAAEGAGARRYSPVVARIAATHGVPLERITGTGRGGRVTKRDVLAHVALNGNGAAKGAAPVEEERPLHSESPYRPDPPAAAPAAPAAAASPTAAAPAAAASPTAAAPAAGASPTAAAPAAGAPAPAAAPLALAPATTDRGGTPQSLSRMRRSIGEAMRNSLSVAATCTTVVEVDMTRVDARRRELGLTALPLVARATIETLREFPELNATLEGDTVTRYERVHLGIAVSLGDDGLIVPVIADAQELSPEGIGNRIRDLATRARSKRLNPDEVKGGTFTITSPGAFGALMATPVIDVPQVAILDLEAIVRRPVVVTDADGAESIAIRSMAHLCMSWDHRAIDGVYAARFLTALRRRLAA